MAANPKFLSLLQRLLNLTLNGKLTWKEGFTPRSYRIVRDYAIIEVGVSDDPQTAEQFYARLEDRAGREVENVSSLDKLPFGPFILPQLYRAAEQNAARGDELIDKLMSDLSQIS